MSEQKVEPFNFQTSIRNLVGDTSRTYTDALKRLSLFARNTFPNPIEDTTAYPTWDLPLDLNTDNIIDSETGLVYPDRDELSYIHTRTVSEVIEIMNSDLQNLLNLLDDYGLNLHRSDVVVIRRTCLLIESKKIYSENKDLRKLVHELYTTCQHILHEREG